MRNNRNPIIIGFFYYSFYPVKGGASVHGYNLAKELALKGYKLLKVNGEPDPYTEKKSGLWGLIYILLVSDIVFVRLDYFKKMRNFIPLVAKLFRKKVMAELNSPSDELRLFGATEMDIQKADRFMRFLSRFVDKFLVVSPPVKKYCTEILQLNNVSVIENGGEVFELEALAVSQEFQDVIEEITTSYDQVAVWAGSPNKMQEMSFIGGIGEALDATCALILITTSPIRLPESLTRRENIYVFSELGRDEVKWIIRQADIGFAFYEDYYWSRWGFYNSSLKVYEYLVNGLWVISNKEELIPIDEHIKLLNDPYEINELMRAINSNGLDFKLTRTWTKVAEEFEKQLIEVINSD